MFLIKLAAGLALLTFGVRFLRKGLDRLLGGRLVAWLEKATKNRTQALGAGIAAGVVAPSSTGLSLLIVRILGDGKISTEKMLAVLLGANLGMTFLANVAALQLGASVGVLLFVGVVCFQFMRRERVRGVGQCILALGFIFLAMDFLREGADIFSRSQDVDQIFAILGRHPYVLGLVVAGLAVLLQSSTATVGLGIGLASGGVLPDSLFIIWVVGTNLGVAATALLVSWSTVEGQRLGLANLLAKIIVAVLAVALLPAAAFSALKNQVPMPQQLALLHTGFNVLVAVLFLPFLGSFLDLIKKILRPDPLPDEVNGRKSFLDPQALETPSIALAHATREALAMTDEVRGMLSSLWMAYQHRNPDQIKNVRSHDDTVDQINRQLMTYLSQIGDLNAMDRKWHFMLLSYSNELEAVGDLIEKNLSRTVMKQLEEDFPQADDDKEILENLYHRTLRQFDLVTSLVTTRDASTAQQLLQAKDDLNRWCLLQKKVHYERLQPGNSPSFSASICFLDLLDGLRRICNHLSTIAPEFNSQADSKPRE